MGHAYSAFITNDLAKLSSGEFLLRIEDIDQSRCRVEWRDLICEDLWWLGLDWPEPVMHQTERIADYQAVLQDLWDREILFACTCNRRDILAAASAPQEGGEVLVGPDGIIYPGKCRDKTKGKTGLPNIPQQALRLDMAKAIHAISAVEPFCFREEGTGPNGEIGVIEFSADELISDIGDVVLGRRDMDTSYHLSVVLDDAAQEITHVVRGEDLFEATKIHVVLQRLLGLPTPVYHHHRLIRDEDGKRLAKRDDARALRLYRAEGKSVVDIRKMVGLEHRLG